MKKKEFNVYIDESGDEGIKKGTKYFILTAIIVDKDKDLELSRQVDIIKENLEISKTSQLHWKLIKGYPNKMMIMNMVSNMDIDIINIVINTSELSYIKSIDVYNSFSGYLYERICEYMKSKNGICNINVSSRGSNLTKNKLLSFLNKKHDKYNIDYKLINDIKIYPNAQKKLLQLADCCCSALGQALLSGDDKRFMFIKTIINNYYNNKGTYLGYGLKYVPGNIKNDNDFNKLINYLKK